MAIVMAKVTVSVKVMAAIKGDSISNGQWQQVSIPIQQIKASGAKAFGMENSAAAVLDLTKVTNPFVIADRFGKTGKTSSSQVPIELDSVYWSK